MKETSRKIAETIEPKAVVGRRRMRIGNINALRRRASSSWAPSQ